MVITDADAATYRTEMDRNMLYVACTRAMHRFTVIGVGAMSVSCQNLAGTRRLQHDKQRRTRRGRFFRSDRLYYFQTAIPRPRAISGNAVDFQQHRCTGRHD
ncbi:hypothetical protein [Tabrizicola caldifontis]|uniref:hypothetical protein n=1 Tax=Tabrizicola caldifontis TaxID=2528036 RepID=UPI001436A628